MLKKSFLYILAKLIKFPARVKEYLSIKLFQKHLKYNLIQVGRIEKKVVIFSIYPGTTSLLSIERILNSFQKTNFTILVVINKNHHQGDVLKLLTGYNCTVLLRSNIGRDIGAYQCGLYFLGGKSFKLNLEKVALVNDSLYTTKHTNDFFETFLNSDFNCVYLNKQGIHHASSHSLVLDRTAMNSRSLIEFWESYYPSSSRIHSVFKGEFGITEALGESYFKPFVSQSQLIQHLTEYRLTDLEKTQIRIWSKRSGLNGVDLLEEYLASNQEFEVIHFCLENFQVSNSLGLYLYRTLKVPIKVDICRNKLVSETSFIKLVGAEMDHLEIEILKQILKPSNAHKSDPIRYFVSRVFDEVKKID